MLTKDQLKDLGARALWTFLQAFAAALAVTGLSIGAVTAAALAGLAAMLSVVKTYSKHRLAAMGEL